MAQERDNFGILSKLKVQCDNKREPQVFTSNKVLCFRSNISTALNDDLAPDAPASAQAASPASSRVSSQLSHLRPAAPREHSESVSSGSSSLSPANANGDGKYDDEVDLSKVRGAAVNLVSQFNGLCISESS